VTVAPRHRLAHHRLARFCWTNCAPRARGVARARRIGLFDMVTSEAARLLRQPRAGTAWWPAARPISSSVPPLADEAGAALLDDDAAATSGSWSSRGRPLVGDPEFAPVLSGAKKATARALCVDNRAEAGRLGSGAAHRGVSHRRAREVLGLMTPTPLARHRAAERGVSWIEPRARGDRLRGVVSRSPAASAPNASAAGSCARRGASTLTVDRRFSDSACCWRETAARRAGGTGPGCSAGRWWLRLASGPCRSPRCSTSERGICRQTPRTSAGLRIAALLGTGGERPTDASGAPSSDRSRDGCRRWLAVENRMAVHSVDRGACNCGGGDGQERRGWAGLAGGAGSELVMLMTLAVGNPARSDRDRPSSCWPGGLFGGSAAQRATCRSREALVTLLRRALPFAGLRPSLPTSRRAVGPADARLSVDAVRAGAVSRPRRGSAASRRLAPQAMFCGARCPSWSTSMDAMSRVRPSALSGGSSTVCCSEPPRWLRLAARLFAAPLLRLVYGAALHHRSAFRWCGVSIGLIPVVEQLRTEDLLVCLRRRGVSGPF